MSRNKFKRNLGQALDRRDQYVSDEDLEKFLDLNYDEDGDWDWDLDDFMDFADEVCNEGFWETVAEYDLHYPGEDENDEEEY